MNFKNIKIIALLFLCFTFSKNSFAGSIAKITRIDGKLFVLRKGTDKWKNTRINMLLVMGDMLYTDKESFAEVEFNSGAILRLDEDTKVIIEEVSKKGSKVHTPLGNIWVNVRKLISSKKSFEFSSPTAVAAIRGTIFNLTSSQDSSSDVKVFDGKVSVGPGSSLQKNIKKKITPPNEIHEVPGPEEVPGPYEVTLDEWRIIVAGQSISVRKDGKFVQKKFNIKDAAKESFIKTNLQLDKKIK